MQELKAEDLLRHYGITDPSAGLNEAEARFKKMLRDLLPALSAENAISTETMGIMGLLTRAQAFHDSACWAIRDGNPFAAYTLIRGYAENAALLVYLRDKPTEIRRISPLAPKSDRLKVGKLVASATKHYEGFQALYDRLSSYAHPESSALLTGFRNTDAGTNADANGNFEWTTAPRWKDPVEGPRWACLWLIEITEMHEASWHQPIKHVQARLRAHPEEKARQETLP